MSDIEFDRFDLEGDECGYSLLKVACSSGDYMDFNDHCDVVSALTKALEDEKAKTRWISVDSAEDLPCGLEVVCWDGCAQFHDYADINTDSGEHFMANGTEVEAYILKPLDPPATKIEE